jgi:GxxExxY protein
MKTIQSSKSFLHGDITEKILEAAFEVSKELGSGFLESVYKNAMVIALREKGLRVEIEKLISVMFRGQSVGQFYADLFVDGKVIVELKAVSALVPEHLVPEHSAQTINYLKPTGIEVGLLINFGRPKIEYKRLHK